jgi:hypothetical protein
MPSIYRPTVRGSWQLESLITLWSMQRQREGEKRKGGELPADHDRSSTRRRLALTNQAHMRVLVAQCKGDTNCSIACVYRTNSALL